MLKPSSDRWEIQPQPADRAICVDGWTLSVGILGLSTVTGNYWANYGSQQDSDGVLPYDDGGLITVGRDYYPMLPAALVEIRFTEVGRPFGKLRYLVLHGIKESSTTPVMRFWDPAGSYRCAVGPINGHTPHSASSTILVGTREVSRNIVWT